MLNYRDTNSGNQLRKNETRQKNKEQKDWKTDLLDQDYISIIDLHLDLSLQNEHDNQKQKWCFRSRCC